ncbi:conserved Plasmodium protein, unknown function [Plasmodium malariae]|uniref:Tyrosine-protein kinase ephrin type A/B receptor-like domain-containing protein n=1 Tax=Plasmodium malariae TaxID=5858 RepID=A0A1A8W4H4_PLAMA|nr:conserved Plasmodium protein, unknown function [Plasmodium malariae]
MSIWYAFFSYAIISCLPVFVSSSFNFCNYGEYFKNNKCYVCEEDSYSSHRNSESCFSCPPSSFNKKRTSKFIYDCTCDNNYYLDYVGNRCDLCSYINNHFYCKKNLNELHVDNLESFFKHKNEISFKNFDRCSVKQKKKNIYPFMNNMYIYCKRPYVCLDTCGKCAEKNEVFNFIFLYLRKGAKNMILEERGNKSESLNNNKIKRIKNFYAKYVRIKKDGSTTENRENMDNSLTVNFYFYYYLKNKMNVNLFHFDEGTTDFSKRHIDEVFLKNYEVVTMKPRRAISKKDIGYIYHSCYIEIQKTAIDRFITKAICIYKQVFKGNYFLFRSEMISVFTDIVRNLRCFKDVSKKEKNSKKQDDN